MKITQKEMAVFFGITENTLVNWKKNKNGRHNLFKACYLYYDLKEQDFLEALTTLPNKLEESLTFMSKDGSFEVEGTTISYKSIGERDINKTIETLTKLKEMIIKINEEGK